MLFVLIHSPLIGPFTWQPVAGVLREGGHAVALPALENSGPPYWERHADAVRASVSRYGPGASAVFVGHSAAGHFLPMAAERSGVLASAYVFVDSGLPRDGLRLREDRKPEELGSVAGFLPNWGEAWPDETWGGLIPDAQLRRRFRAELRPTPLALFDEPVTAPSGWPDAPCAYLLFSAFYRPLAEEALGRGWPVREVRSQHLHMLVEPEVVAAAILSLTSEMGRTT